MNFISFIADDSNLPNQVYLRPLVSHDQENVCRWLISPYILHYSFVVPGPSAITSDFCTDAYAQRYFDTIMNDVKRQNFAIMVGGYHVGNIGLKDIDKSKKYAECCIEIGESRFRGLGIGYQAMKQVLDIAFLDLGLTTIELEVLEFNYTAIRLYHNLGFVSQPSSSWHYDEFGIYWRVLKMSINCPQN